MWTKGGWHPGTDRRTRGQPVVHTSRSTDRPQLSPGASPGAGQLYPGVQQASVARSWPGPQTFPVVPTPSSAGGEQKPSPRGRVPLDSTRVRARAYGSCGSTYSCFPGALDLTRGPSVRLYRTRGPRVRPPRARECASCNVKGPSVVEDPSCVPGWDQGAWRARCLIRDVSSCTWS